MEMTAKDIKKAARLAYNKNRKEFVEKNYPKEYWSEILYVIDLIDDEVDASLEQWRPKERKIRGGK